MEGVGAAKEEQLFSYLLAPGPLKDSILNEVEKYRWHARNGSVTGDGWLPTALYSQIQQAVRMDPLLYILTVCLRKDRNWRLISFPYLMRYAAPGDDAAFRRMESHVDELLLGVGASRLQVEAALEDEDVNNVCIKLVGGFHHYLAVWLSRLEERGYEENAVLHNIDDETYTEEDAIVFGQWDLRPLNAATAM